AVRSLFEFETPVLTYVRGPNQWKSTCFLISPLPCPSLITVGNEQSGSCLVSIGGQGVLPRSQNRKQRNIAPSARKHPCGAIMRNASHPDQFRWLLAADSKNRRFS